MSHIFISYSHKDKEYVEKLERELIKEGFEVWFDGLIPYGTEWSKDVQKYLDTCDAFVVVMSRNSFESDIVQNEVARAREKKKDVFPILLDGENWLIVQAKQHLDVRDRKLPSPKFYEDLSKVVKINYYQRALISFPPNHHKYRSNMRGELKLYDERTVYYGVYRIVNLTKNEIGKTLKVSVQTNSENVPFRIELWPGVFDGIDVVTWAKSRGNLITQSKEQLTPELTWEVAKGECTLFFVASGKYIPEYHIPFEDVIDFKITYTVEVF